MALAGSVSVRSAINHQRHLSIILWCFVLCASRVALHAQEQQAQPQLSPSEAFRAAMDPFTQAREQNGDLTEADKLALSLGIARAAQDCQALTAPPHPSPPDPAQKLALGRLCLFGQQYAQASASLEGYLALLSPPDRETALILLVRAFLGLKSPGSAAIQVYSLFRDYPYDAQIHTAADEAISACEDTYLGLDTYATQICKKQADATLPLLMQGKSLQSKEGAISPAALYADALRCTMLARDTGSQTTSLDSTTGDESLDSLAKIVEETAWQHTADLPLMQQSLARAQMVGQRSPLEVLHAKQLSSNGPLIPRVLTLGRGTIVLVPFTLWSPSAPEVIQKVLEAAPSASIYALSSWSANTGVEDVATPPILSALRQLRKGLSPKVTMLMVPDTELSAFHVDQYPVGIAIHNGIVLSNVVLADDGSIRMALHAVQPAAPAPKSNLSK